jgi:hypothetical protein
MENNYIIFNQSGRFGNAIFRYMAYVMLQKENNNFKYILDTDFSKLVTTPYTNEETNEETNVKNTKIINEDNYFKYMNTDISKLPDNRNISLHGYFQYDHIYLQNKSYILEFVEQNKNVHQIRTDDETYLTKYIIDEMILDSSKIYENVIHIRLGDFNGRPDFIETEYLLRLLDNIKDIFYNKTAIVIETPKSDADIDKLKPLRDFIFNFKNYANQLSADQRQMLFKKEAKIVKKGSGNIYQYWMVMPHITEEGFKEVPIGKEAELAAFENLTGIKLNKQVSAQSSTVAEPSSRELPSRGAEMSAFANQLQGGTHGLAKGMRENKRK